MHHDQLYRIVVRGPGADRLGDLIETTAVAVEGEQMIITTRIVDGSHLRGVLDRIADLGLQLVTLERVQPGHPAAFGSGGQR